MEDWCPSLPPFLRWSAKVSVVNAYVKHNFFGPLTRIISNNIVICSKLENTKKNWLRERILICCFKNTVFECFAKNATVNKNTGVICAKYTWVVCCMIMAGKNSCPWIWKNFSGAWIKWIKCAFPAYSLFFTTTHLQCLCCSSLVFCVSSPHCHCWSLLHPLSEEKHQIHCHIVISGHCRPFVWKKHKLLSVWYHQLNTAKTR